MRVVRRHKISGLYEHVSYPRNDMQPVVGLDPNIQFYVIVDTPPAYDYRTHKLVEATPVFSNEPYQGHAHLGTFTKTYELLQLSNEQIIDNLNQSLAEYCDTTYPVWQRLKHHNEANYLLYDENFDTRNKNDLTPEQYERFAYILSLGEWLNRCRAERDTRENNLVSNGTLPIFEWEPMPDNE